MKDLITIIEKVESCDSWQARKERETIPGLIIQGFVDNKLVCQFSTMEIKDAIYLLKKKKEEGKK